MTVEDVEELAKTFGTSGFRPVAMDAHGITHVLSEGATVFWFHFDNGRLRTVQEGIHYGITGLETSIREDLCTGQKTADVSLTITAPQDLAGATLSIDGVQTANLSRSSADADIDGLPSGTHELWIVKSGYEPIVKRYHYRPREYWPKDSALHIAINETDVRQLRRQHGSLYKAISRSSANCLIIVGVYENDQPRRIDEEPSDGERLVTIAPTPVPQPKKRRWSASEL